MLRHSLTGHAHQCKRTALRSHTRAVACVLLLPSSLFYRRAAALSLQEVSCPASQKLIPVTETVSWVVAHVAGWARGARGACIMFSISLVLSHAPHRAVAI